MKKLTKELLLERATKKSEENKYKEYPCEFLGGSLIIKRLPLTQVCDMLDQSANASTTDSLNLYKELIYKSVPMFKDEQLISAYDCIEPYDVVTAVFEDNLGELTKLAEFILTLYGLQDVEDEVKN